jgi:hypothetical protein
MDQVTHDSVFTILGFRKKPKTRIRSVSQAALQSSTGAGQLLDAAKGLSRLAIKLNDLVAKLEAK